MARSAELIRRCTPVPLGASAADQRAAVQLDRGQLRRSRQELLAALRRGRTAGRCGPEDRRDDRQRARNEQRPGRALQRARRDQQRHRRRQRAAATQRGSPTRPRAQAPRSRSPKACCRRAGCRTAACGWPAGPGARADGRRRPRRLYDVWLRGSFGRRVAVAVDGRTVGSARWRENYPLQYEPLGRVTLAAGRHRFDIVRGGGNVLPGTGNEFGPEGITTRIGPIALVAPRCARRGADRGSRGGHGRLRPRPSAGLDRGRAPALRALAPHSTA